MIKYTEVKCYWKPLFCKDKRHTKLIQIVTLHSTNPRTSDSKNDNRKFFCSFIFGDTSHMSTIQYLKVKIRNTYLTLQIVQK
jgi:hypothetical protein